VQFIFSLVPLSVNQLDFSSLRSQSRLYISRMVQVFTSVIVLSFVLCVVSNVVPKLSGRINVGRGLIQGDRRERISNGCSWQRLIWIVFLFCESEKALGTICINMINYREVNKFTNNLWRSKHVHLCRHSMLYLITTNKMICFPNLSASWEHILPESEIRNDTEPFNIHWNLIRSAIVNHTNDYHLFNGKVVLC
jgi:hypothetical protein